MKKLVAIFVGCVVVVGAGAAVKLKLAQREFPPIVWTEMARAQRLCEFCADMVTPPCGTMVCRTHGRCLRCDRPWCTASSHSTMTDDGRGAGPLCEDCWAALTVEERLPYYHILMLRWSPGGGISDRWPLIREAVLAGK